MEELRRHKSQEAPERARAIGYGAAGGPGLRGWRELPYFQEDGITIYHGDCRDVLRCLQIE